MSGIEVLHISSAPSLTEFSALKKAVKPLKDDVGYGMPESSFNFHDLLRTGLAQNEGVRVLSLVGRPIHPSVHSRLFWRKKIERVSPNLTIEQVSIINVRVVKQIGVGIKFFGAILRWRRQSSRAAARILIVDAAYVTVLPWVLLALAGSGVRKLGIFADVYSYMGKVDDARGVSSLLHSAVRRVVQATYARLDGFVLLTRQMNDVVNPSNKPHMIMEGMVDFEGEIGGNGQVFKAELPTVLYAGALRKEYGLDDLLAGFAALPYQEVKLVVYGAGPYSADIIAASDNDARIFFGGRIPVPQVMLEQRKAWLLVNTRRADDEFTKYSFPSKVLSYMSSGTAVLTTKLPGMPEDYNEHLFMIEGQGARGITHALDEVLRLPLRDLEKIGTQAQAFVLASKNNVIQTRRILDFATE